MSKDTLKNRATKLNLFLVLFALSMTVIQMVFPVVHSRELDCMLMIMVMTGMYSTKRLLRPIGE